MKRKILSLMLTGVLACTGLFTNSFVSSASAAEKVKTTTSDSVVLQPISKDLIGDDSEIRPMSGGYDSSTYKINKTISNTTVYETQSVLIDTYAPVGSTAVLSSSKSGSISLQVSGSSDLKAWLKGQLTLTGSLSYSYTKGYNIPIPAKGSYQLGRPILKAQYRVRKVNVTEVQKYWYPESGTTYKTLTYDTTIKEPVKTYIEIQYTNK